MQNVDQEVVEDAQDAARRGAKPDGGDGPWVGAAVRATDGGIYTGSAVETEDRHQSLHAERLAVANAVTAHDDPNPVESVSVCLKWAADEESTHARVCGSCLHFISEFSVGDVPVCIIHMDGQRHTSLEALYPEPWSIGSEYTDG